MYWVDSADALFVQATSLSNREVLRVFRDGTTLRFGSFSFNNDGIQFASSSEHNGVLVLSSAFGGWYSLHPQTWTPNLQKPFTSAVTSANADHSVVLRNRAGVLKHLERFGKGYRVRNITTDAVEDTVEIYTGGFNLDKRMHWVADQTILAVRSDGAVWLYDTDTKTVLLESHIDAPRETAFDTTNGNIMSVRNSDRILQIYDTVIEPDSMSAISATPGTYTRYHTEALSVTVLGSNSEPIEGVEVEWEVQTTGSSEGAVNGAEVNSLSVNAGAPFVEAKGKISPNISVTNASGIATATYCPPGLDWLSGDKETITAVVRI
jgi:hypothetical protein